MDDMLELLRCPVTGQSLRKATGTELNAFGFKLTTDSPEGTGDCKSSDNSSVPRDGFDKSTAGLIREDGRVLYPVKAGIPILLPDSAISLRQEPSPQ
jgi:uncharacterized protein YbaR (Trm112 family)